MPSAVVFDCDGVLVDSEELAWDAWRVVLGRYGIEVSSSAVAELTGRTEEDAYRYFSEMADLPRYESLWPELAAAVTSRFETHLRAFEDAEATLAVLSERGVPVAVASSSPRERLDLSLRRTGLDRFVTTSVAGDEVAQGKPKPDLYREAADRLGLDPSDCVAVEDTPAGLRAARAAGMRVVVVDRGRYRPEELAAADEVVDRLSAELVLGVG